MSIYDLFETDPNLETGEGVKIDLGNGVSITIHRAGSANRKFVMRQQALVKPYQRQIDNNTLPDEKNRELTIRLYAETVVIGFEGMTDRAGNPLEYSVENTIKLLTDLPDLYRLVMQESNDRTLFLRKTQDDAAGN